jgi:hypothetical protein
LFNSQSPAPHFLIILDLPQPAGKVVLVNTTRADIRVWRMGNQWGDASLSFEVLQGDQTWHIVRQPQVYTRNVPSSVVVPAGSTHEWLFNLRDGQWDAGAPLDQWIIPGAQLIAIFDVPLSTEAVEQGVWTGQLRSQPVQLDASNPGSSTTPHRQRITRTRRKAPRR